MGSGPSAFGERLEKNQDNFYLLIPVMVIVRSRSVGCFSEEIFAQCRMFLGRDRGSATKKSGKVRTLGRVRLRVCECVSHDTYASVQTHSRQWFRRWRPFTVAKGRHSLAEDFQSSACPLINRAAFHKSLKVFAYRIFWTDEGCERRSFLPFESRNLLRNRAFQ